MMASYLGEFVFTILYYLYLAFVLRSTQQDSEIQFRQFIYPALCDFTGNLLFIFGLSNTMANNSMMTKAVALPIAAIFCKWSLIKIRKTFNSKQIVALLGILIGVTWTTIASFDMSKEELLTS